MSIKWEAVTAIATSGTVIAVLGVEMIKALLEKPKVKLLSAMPLGWFDSYELKQGKRLLNGTQLVIKLKLKNEGSETTSIDGEFISEDGKTFVIENSFELNGHGNTNEEIISLHLPEIGYFEKGKSLRGELRLRPWHNRRFFIFGKQWLTIKLEIPNQEVFGFGDSK
jgi:hypothetical protein